MPLTTGCLSGYLICIPLHQPREASQQGPAGRSSLMMDNFCLQTHCVVLFISLLFMSLTDEILSLYTKPSQSTQTSSMTALIILILDGNNCDGLAAFYSSPIITNKTAFEWWILVCSNPSLVRRLQPVVPPAEPEWHEPLCSGGWSARSHQRPVGYLLLCLSLAHAHVRRSKELIGATALGRNEVGAVLEPGHWAFTWSDADISELFEDTT